MEKFCCDQFKIFYSGPNEFGLNIRIVKLSDAFVKRGQLNFNKSFLITEGYTNTINDCKKTMTIQFCPFCGRELKKFYGSNDYVQEIIDL
jgi:hypothetical protein